MKIKKRKEEINMKKLVSLFLALALVFSLTISASAASVEGNATFHSGTLTDGQTAWDTTNESTGTVKVTVNDNLTPDVYCVTVTWGVLDFTYNLNANSGGWNPETHMYDGQSSQAGWVNGNSGDITVANDSNKPVNVEVEIDGADPLTPREITNSGFKTTITGDENGVLSAPLVTEAGQPKTETPSMEFVYTVTVTGDPVASVDAYQVATVKVIVTAA